MSGINTRNENFDRHSIGVGSTFRHTCLHWLVCWHDLRVEFVVGSLVIFDGTFRAYKAASSNRVMGDDSDADCFYRFDCGAKIFALIRAERRGSFHSCPGDVGFMDVGDLPALADRERTS